MAPRSAWTCRVFVVGALALALFVAQPARAASDPRLSWWTLETPHFRVHYYNGLEPAARKVASIAEGVNERLSEIMGWRSSEVTEIVLSDASDDANGSATAVPFNAVYLFVTAPDDISPLADYDDWFLALVTHEYTHVLHTDNVTGVPALLNRVAGKRWVPNQSQPRWILEGLAVLHESVHTGGGRNRSSIFDMYLRADVLDGRLVPLDQMSHLVRRWPQGNISYLYGSRFLTWITDVYGPGALRATAQDYGRQVVPWGLNRSMRRATGRTYEELYRGWASYLDDHYRAQLDQIFARGLREGKRLTTHGQTVASPRFVPAAARRDPNAEEILYFRSDGHDRAGFYQRPLSSGARGGSDDAERLVARANGHSSASYADDGRLVFGSVAISNQIYAYNDLFTLPPGITAPRGWEPERTRLTTGERAEDPDVARDGGAVVFTENHRGTSTLMIATLAPDGALGRPRPLVASARYEQAYTPRFSRDGQRVTYSAWTEGGYRDIRVVDVKTGGFFELMRDRAMDWQPSFTSDGKYVVFASDRVLGIPNIFAFDLGSGKLWQVTNVKTGALYPTVSEDGKRLVYAGYTSYGFDLFEMEFDPSAWLDPVPYADERPDLPAPGLDAVTERHPYQALQTLRPRSWDFDYGPGPFGGTAVSVTARAADVLSHHGLSASLLVDSERAEPQGAVAYAYARLPFDFRTSLSRTVEAIKRGAAVPIFYRPSINVTSGISYATPSEFESSTLSLSYTISRFDGALPLSPRPDPYAVVRPEPARGQIGAARVGWSFSNAESYLKSVGAARGFTLALNVELASPVLASDYEYVVFSYAASGYVGMPWARHHTLALHAESGLSAGSNPRAFSTGGFLERPLFDSYALGAYQGPFVLRGYPALAFSGTQYHLLNAEYRLPIVNVDRGVSTLPVFFHRLNGNVFADYGGAFNGDATGRRLHLGVGVELWAELTLGYFVSAHIRVGHARGVSDPQATPDGQTYVVLSAPF